MPHAWLLATANVVGMEGSATVAGASEEVPTCIKRVNGMNVLGPKRDGRATFQNDNTIFICHESSLESLGEYLLAQILKALFNGH